jgi:hypothetical protein
MGTLEEIERTKRAEPTVLFLEGEGVIAPKPKMGKRRTSQAPTISFDGLLAQLAEDSE